MRAILESMSTTLPFENKIALVTGSGRGIGRAIALHLARNGADVIINYFRNRQPAEETAREIHDLGRRVLVIKANVGEIDELNAMFDRVESEFPGLDILINNAASGYNRPAMQQKVKGWNWTMNVNARSLLFSVQRAVPLMEKRGGGAVVSLTSPGSTRVLPDYIVVGASKAAIEALTRYLAVELSHKNIIVNAVSPGVVLTDALVHFNIMRKEDILEKAIRRTPMGRLPTQEDVAGVVAFLCSRAASMICGQTIVVDGGFTLPVDY